MNRKQVPTGDQPTGPWWSLGKFRTQNRFVPIAIAKNAPKILTDWPVNIFGGWSAGVKFGSFGSAEFHKPVGRRPLVNLRGGLVQPPIDVVCYPPGRRGPA